MYMCICIYVYVYGIRIICIVCVEPCNQNDASEVGTKYKAYLKAMPTAPPLSTRRFMAGKSPKNKGENIGTYRKKRRV